MKHFVSMSSIIRTHACKKVSVANFWAILYRNCGISVQVFFSSSSTCCNSTIFSSYRFLSVFDLVMGCATRVPAFPSAFVARWSVSSSRTFATSDKHFLFFLSSSMCSAVALCFCVASSLIYFCFSSSRYTLYLDLADATEDSNSLVMGTLRTLPQTET